MVYTCTCTNTCNSMLYSFIKNDCLKGSFIYYWICVYLLRQMKISRVKSLLSFHIVDFPCLAYKNWGYVFSCSHLHGLEPMESATTNHPSSPGQLLYFLLMKKCLPCLVSLDLIYWLNKINWWIYSYIIKEYMTVNGIL